MKQIPLAEILYEFKDTPPPNSTPEVLTLTERNGFVRQADRFNKRLALEDVSGYKHISKNEIAFNPYLLWAGAIAQNSEWDSGVISPLYPTFRLKPGFDSKYVIRLLLSEELIGKYDSIAFGSVPRRRRSSVKDFLGLTVPEPPPLDSQQRIAEVLDRADGLRAKRRQAITLLDELTSALFASMFGKSLDDLKSWPEIALTDALVGTPQNGLYRPSTDYGEGTPIVRIDCFYDGVITKINSLKRVRIPIEEENLYSLNENDILVNRVNSIEHLGKSALVPPLTEPTVFESNMMRLVTDQSIVDSDYLISALQTSDIKMQIRKCAKNSVNQSSINQRDVRELRIPLPPLTLQQEFTMRKREINALKPSHLAHLTHLDALFASLQSRAFRGELWQNDLDHLEGEGLS